MAQIVHRAIIARNLLIKCSCLQKFPITRLWTQVGPWLELQCYGNGFHALVLCGYLRDSGFSSAAVPRQTLFVGNL